MNLKEMIAERDGLADSMRSVHELAESESRGFTPEEREKWDAMTAGLAAIDDRIERGKQLDGIQPVELPFSQLPAEAQGQAPTPKDENRGLEYGAVFDAYMRRGFEGLNTEQVALMQEHRAQATSPGSAGGFNIPEGFGGRIIETMAKFGGLINDCTVLNTSTGNPLPFPTNDSSGEIGEILAENTQANEEDLTFGQTSLGAYKYSSKMVRVSGELLQDEEVNLESYLTNILGKRLGRITSQHYCTGTGTGQPEGITVGTTLTAPAASATALAFQDMLDLEHTVDPVYRLGGVGRFLFNDGTLKEVKGLVDGESRPLWLPRVADAAPATILGLPYTIDQGMPDVGADNDSVVFGDLTAYYVRQVMGINLMRLTERYADFYQVGFVAFSRSDAALMDAGAVAKITHPSS